jgi:hypothetical protein
MFAVKRTKLQAIVSGLWHQYHPVAVFPVADCLDRNSIDFELVNLVVHGNESVSIITEAQQKFTVNFSSLNFLNGEML